jgi:hypothetical protein
MARDLDFDGLDGVLEDAPGSAAFPAWGWESSPPRWSTPVPSRLVEPMAVTPPRVHPGAPQPALFAPPSWSFSLGPMAIGVLSPTGTVLSLVLGREPRSSSPPPAAEPRKTGADP